MALNLSLNETCAIFFSYMIIFEDTYACRPIFDGMLIYLKYRPVRCISVIQGEGPCLIVSVVLFHLSLYMYI